ncbi:MAG: GTPase Era, partial [Pseudomonadales bacterium]|nr:GTPase Era [Pseudomonadales bacterium]
NWTDEDEYVVQSIRQSTAPVILAINKVDHLVEKNRLLPHIQALSAKLAWADVVPVAAKTGYNLEPLQTAIRKRLPARAHFYDAEQVTDRSERFLAAEIVREKIMRMMGDELPHKVAVEIEQYKTTSKLVTISAVIWVEREGQKKILIGVKGEKLKLIGSQARADIEVLVDQKVMLKLWVKVKGSWSDDERMLKSLGYADQ